ncbi:MAG: hypothetical protein RLZZ591_1949 [Pseudomonadota bacterium]|jgi:YbgC/YbaW family acyl-CoA thioester hydrolase
MTDTTAPTRQGFRFFHRLRVRWAEVDMQKIVFNAHYLMYVDTAFGDYWRALALPYADTMHQLGGDLFVKKASIEFHASAHWDDQIDVALRCARIGKSSMLFEGAIFRGQELLITAELIYVYADPATQTSRPVPDALRGVLEAYERGESMVQTDMGSWETLSEGLKKLRMAVFVQEQGIPEAEEWDEADHTALHALTTNRLGLPLATGRLLSPTPGTARVGRLAVHKLMRGTGLAKDMVQRLMTVARERGDTTVVLDAQCSAVGFYASLGFESRGATFMDAGIEHIEMARAL